MTNAIDPAFKKLISQVETDIETKAILTAKRMPQIFEQSYVFNLDELELITLTLRDNGEQTHVFVTSNPVASEMFPTLDAEVSAIKISDDKDLTVQELTALTIQTLKDTLIKVVGMIED